MWIHQEETKRISYIDQLEIQISDGGYVEVGPEWYGIRECSPFSRLYYINGGKAWEGGSGGDISDPDDPNGPRGTWH